jgi:hypothetical protein
LLITKRLKRRCGSGWDNSWNTSVLRVSTPWYRNGTSVSMWRICREIIVFTGFEYNVCFIFICDLFTNSPTYVILFKIFPEVRVLCGSNQTNIFCI